MGHARMVGLHGYVLPALASAGVMACASPVSGQLCSPVETQRVLTSDGDVGDFFGSAGAIQLRGDTLIVGARGDSEAPFIESGAAYVFRHDGVGWVEEAKLVGTDPADTDQMGWAVALEGDRALVGAHLDDDNGVDSGSVYAFEFDGVAWNNTEKITPSDGAESDSFGRQIVIDGDTAFIGAWIADGAAAENAGAVYVYRHDGAGWVESQRLTASDGESGDGFGEWLSVAGDRALIAAPFAGDGGAAYAFEFDGVSWVESQKLVSSDNAADDVFGNTVAMDGDVAVVSAVYDDDNGDFSGSLYVYRHDGVGWVEDDKLIASDGEERDFFGYASISGDTILAGARSDDDVAENAGAAYVFRHDGAGWVEASKLTASDGGASDVFGWAVALEGDTAIIGAKNYDLEGGGVDAGAVYAFDLGCVADCVADVNGDGVLLPNDFSVWIVAFNTQSAGCDQNGDGLCLPNDFTGWILNYNNGCE